MANASISFNGDKLIQELDLLTQVQLPFLGAVTVNKLVPIVRKDLQHEMRDSFTKVTAFTLASVRKNHFATKVEPWAEIYLLDKADKGNAPADYLKPQITGGLVYQTRFQWRLKTQIDGYNGRYMLPLHDSPGTKKDKYGRMRVSQYVEALYGVKAFEDIRASMRPGKYRTEGSYMYVRKSTKASKPRSGPTRIQGGPGIYRVMGKNLVQVFKQLDSVPTVPKSFDFAFAADLSVKNNFAAVFNQVQQQYARR